MLMRNMRRWRRKVSLSLKSTAGERGASNYPARCNILLTSPAYDVILLGNLDLERSGSPPNCKEFNHFMAIANELSSEVAAAVLADKEGINQTDTRHLVTVVRNFYSALRPLTIEARRRKRIRPHLSDSPPQAGSRAASGNH